MSRQKSAISQQQVWWERSPYSEGANSFYTDEKSRERAIKMEEDRMKLFSSSIGIIILWREKQVAAIQSYCARHMGYGFEIDISGALGSEEAIKESIDLREMSDFSVVVNKCGETITYTGCEWSRYVGCGPIIEKATIYAANRKVSEFE